MSAFGGKADISPPLTKVDSRSPQLLGAAQAADHGNPKQIVTDQSRIASGSPEPFTEIVIGRFEIFLILNRLSLHMFLGHKSTLQIESIELGFGLRAAPDPDQTVRQVYRIVDTAIHSHPAERV